MDAPSSNPIDAGGVRIVCETNRQWWDSIVDIVPIVLFGGLAWLTWKAPSAGFRLLAGLFVVAAVGWIVHAVLVRPSRHARIVADLSTRLITFEHCRFYPGLWPAKIEPSVRLPLRDVHRAIPWTDRYGGIAGFTIRTVRGTLYLGSEMTNFKELGFLLMANPDRNHCSHCGYELRDNTSGRCPECGLKLAR